MSSYEITDLNKVKRSPKRGSYDKALINEILDAGFLCHIAYIYEGRPIIIPTAYARQDDKIFIHGSLKNRMMNALLDCGEASLTVTHLDGLVLARSAMHHSANYRSVTIFGKVRLLEERKEKWDALGCILNHMVPGHWDQVRQPNEKEFKSTLVFEVQIESAAAKVRAEGVNDEAEDYDLPIWAGVVPIKQVALAPENDDRLLDGVKTPNSVLDYVKANQL